LAALLMRIPTLAFEPNLVPGFANRVVSRFVRAAAVHFEETKKFFHNARVTGVPVRQEFFKIPGRSFAPPGSLLVFGGSQGARILNQTMIDAIPKWRELGIHIRHQTGERDFERVDVAYKEANVPAEVSRFIDDMPAAFAQADAVLCRSGASTVAEITAAGKPAIFVPFALAADDHQLKNAQALETAGAARLLPESQLSPDSLSSVIAEMFANPTALVSMSAKARSLAHPNAGKEIAEMARQVIGGREQGTE
jgi:UDP-N-acetylglucosamine--N-acetylmuramyl-(pentapeptide) pyrophosphoryl-undecaprenol N-acetylglucosamine transferase